MHVSQFLTPDSVAVGLKAGSKAELIDAMIALLEGRSEVVDLAAVRTAVLRRENSMSTGVGKGLALPHAKTNAVSRTVAAMAVTADPVPFEAIDDLPIRLVFLLVGEPDAKSQHVKVLSRISRLMNREAVRKKLSAASTPQELLDALQEAENNLLDE